MRGCLASRPRRDRPGSLATARAGPFSRSEEATKGSEPMTDHPPTKHCPRCGETKPREAFGGYAAARDGLQRRCRECAAALSRADRAARRAAGRCQASGCTRDAVPGRGGHCDPCADEHTARLAAKRAADPTKHREDNRDRRARNAARTPEEVAAARDRLRPDGLKRCRKCRDRVPLVAFGVNRTAADGLRDECRACHGADLLRAALPAWEDRDTWSCVYCGAPFADVDHVRPKSDHDAEEAAEVDHPRNLAPSCADCNRGPGGKHARDVLEFVADRLGADVAAAVMSWPVRVVAIV
ncbi:HNH endonuclease [Micromonospora tulbaghiae]